jgi:hypothetical protein
VNFYCEMTYEGTKLTSGNGRIQKPPHDSISRIHTPFFDLGVHFFFKARSQGSQGLRLRHCLCTVAREQRKLQTLAPPPLLNLFPTSKPEMALCSMTGEEEPELTGAVPKALRLSAPHACKQNGSTRARLDSPHRAPVNAPAAYRPHSASLPAAFW